MVIKLCGPIRKHVLLDLFKVHSKTFMMYVEYFAYKLEDWKKPPLDFILQMNITN